MSFLFPNFLYALAFLAIPVIIHLFNFRSTTVVYFSNVEFLKNTQNQTRSKFRLKYWLVLLMRMLFVGALVLAFAQPFVPAKQSLANQNTEQTKVLFYIDNSFSMDGETTEGKAIEVAKQKAAEIAAMYKQNAGFMLITNDLLTKHQHWLSLKQWTNYLAEIQTTPRFLTLDDLMAKLKFFRQELEPNQKLHVYFLSDFQRQNTNLAQLKLDTLSQFHFIPIEQAAINNLSIDSCWFDTPIHYRHAKEILNIRIKNYANQHYQNIPVQLLLNDTLKGMSALNIESNETKTLQIPFTNSGFGFIEGKITISDYPITFDNTYFFSYEIKNFIKVLNLFEKQPNPDFAKLYQLEQSIRFENHEVSKFKFSDIQESDVIILDELTEISSGLSSRLTDFLQRGKSIVVVPNPNANLETYNSFFAQNHFFEFDELDTASTKIEKIAYNHYIFNNVFEEQNTKISLPYIRSFYHYKTPISPLNQLLSNTFNNTFLASKETETGILSAFSFSLQNNNSNFMNHPLAVPTFLNFAFFNKFQPTIAYTIGQNNVLFIGNEVLANDEIVKIRAANQFEFIPQMRRFSNKVSINIHNMIQKSGIYTVENKNTPNKKLAFNYARNESDLTFYTVPEITQFCQQNPNAFVFRNSSKEQLNSQITNLYFGKQLWKYFIILALLALLFEVLIIRFFK